MAISPIQMAITNQTNSLKLKLISLGEFLFYEIFIPFCNKEQTRGKDYTFRRKP